MKDVAKLVIYNPLGSGFPTHIQEACGQAVFRIDVDCCNDVCKLDPQKVLLVLLVVVCVGGDGSHVKAM